MDKTDLGIVGYIDSYVISVGESYEWQLFLGICSDCCREKILLKFYRKLHDQH